MHRNCDWSKDIILTIIQFAEIGILVCNLLYVFILYVIIQAFCSSRSKSIFHYLMRSINNLIKMKSFLLTIPNVYINTLAKRRSGRWIYDKTSKDEGTWDQYQKTKITFSQPNFSRKQKDSLILLINTLSLYKRLINLNVSDIPKKNLNLWCIFPSLALLYVCSVITHLFICRRRALQLEQNHSSVFSAGTNNVVCMVRFLVWIGFFLHLFVVRKGVENIACFYIHSSKNTFLTDCHILFTNHTAKETCYIKKYVYLETKGHGHS